jgi:metal iron transporter
LSVLDALTILLVYNPAARLYFIRPFEIFIGVIVMTIFFLFVVELTKVDAPAGEVFKGYLPSRGVFVGQGYVRQFRTIC